MIYQAIALCFVGAALAVGLAYVQVERTCESMCATTWNGCFWFRFHGTRAYLCVSSHMNDQYRDVARCPRVVRIMAWWVLRRHDRRCRSVLADTGLDFAGLPVLRCPECGIEFVGPVRRGALGGVRDPEEQEQR